MSTSSLSQQYLATLQTKQQETGVCHFTGTVDKFEVKVDVQQFTPDELCVKTVDKYVVIEAKHQEKRDQHGLISRHFVRRYLLPEGVKPEAINCTLSSDKILTVSAPRVIETPPTKEIIIPILQTGQPCLLTSPVDSMFSSS